MKKWLKRIVLGLVAVLVALQFVPVERNNPSERDQPDAPADVRLILQRACYDCHSNETHWPWYSQIAPISFLMAHDVAEGRRELNFSLWGNYDERRKARKLKEIAEQVDDGEMPLWYYVVIHPEAQLSQGDRQLMTQWAKPR